MSQLDLHLPDEQTLSVAPGTTYREALKQAGAPRSTVAVRVNGDLHDLSQPATNAETIAYIDLNSPEGLALYRHSTSHIMAAAVQELFPDAQVTIGPAIADGFYYDFDTARPFTPDDLKAIETRMQEIIKRNTPFERREMDRDAAIAFFRERNEPYKVELIEDLDQPRVSLYATGDFVDLCRGPHLGSTGMVKACTLTSSAGAYWRGNEQNKMLQRIYGTAFPDRKQLKQHLRRIEEAKKRDHRKLGKALDLFSIYDEAGAGLIVYHPKGALVRRLLEDFEVREHLARGYQLVKGPQILKQDLWAKSGHLDNYRENMYFTEIDGIQYGLKPMNCVAHMLIYQSRLHSYKDLPVRYFELGTVNRHEKSGVLHGLTRVREFTQDDAHILCMPAQLQTEITGVIDFVRDIMQVFGFSFEVELSTRPEKSIGNEADWERATNALRTALDSHGLDYAINEGDGAFYGPKIDFKLQDCLNREWQCATIQCDFFLPDRFDLHYIGEDGEKHRPVMLHRVILGSLERFLGILIEHYAGAFPVWLAPVQARLITIADAHNAFADTVRDRLQQEGLRVECDQRNESLNYKIRQAQLEKIPYMLIIGNQEVEQGGVSPRTLDGVNLGFMTVENFIENFKRACDEQLHPQACNPEHGGPDT